MSGERRREFVVQREEQERAYMFVFPRLASNLQTMVFVEPILCLHLPSLHGVISHCLHKECLDGLVT